MSNELPKQPEPGEQLHFKDGLADLTYEQAKNLPEDSFVVEKTGTSALSTKPLLERYWQIIGDEPDLPQKRRRRLATENFEKVIENFYEATVREEAIPDPNTRRSSEELITDFFSSYIEDVGLEGVWRGSRSSINYETLENRYQAVEQEGEFVNTIRDEATKYLSNLWQRSMETSEDQPQTIIETIAQRVHDRLGIEMEETAELRHKQEVVKFIRTLVGTAEQFYGIKLDKTGSIPITEEGTALTTEEAIEMPSDSRSRISLEAVRAQNQEKLEMERREQEVEARLIRIFNEYHPKLDEGNLQYGAPWRSPDAGKQRSSLIKFMTGPIGWRGKGHTEWHTNTAAEQLNRGWDKIFKIELQKAKETPEYLNTLEERLSVVKLVYAEQDLLVLRGPKDLETGKREFDQYQEALRGRINQLKQRGSYTEEQNNELSELETKLAQEESQATQDKKWVDKASAVVKKLERKYWSQPDRVEGIKTELSDFIINLSEAKNLLKQRLEDTTDSSFKKNIDKRGVDIALEELKAGKLPTELTYENVQGVLERLDQATQNTLNKLNEFKNDTDWVTGDESKLAQVFLEKREAAIRAIYQLNKFVEIYLGGEVIKRKGQEPADIKSWRKNPDKAPNSWLRGDVGLVTLALVFGLSSGVAISEHTGTVESHESTTHLAVVVDLEERDQSFKNMAEQKGASPSELSKYLVQRAVIDLLPDLYGNKPIDPKIARLAYDQLTTAKLLGGDRYFNELARDVLLTNQDGQSSGDTLLELAAKKLASPELAVKTEKNHKTEAEGLTVLEHLDEITSAGELLPSSWEKVSDDWQEGLAHLQKLPTPEAKLNYIRDILEPAYGVMEHAFVQNTPDQEVQSDSVLMSDWLEHDAGRQKLEAIKERLIRESDARTEWSKIWADWQGKVAKLNNLDSPQEQKAWLENTLRPLADKLTEKYDNVDPSLRYAVQMKLFDKDASQPGFDWSDDELMRRDKEGDSTIQQWVNTMIKVAQIKIDRAA